MEHSVRVKHRCFKYVLTCLEQVGNRPVCVRAEGTVACGGKVLMCKPR